MNKLPTVKAILNTPSIFDGYTFEDLVTLGRINANDATSNCMIHAQKEYMKNPRWTDVNNLEAIVKAWSNLEAQVHRKFKEAEKIASII